MKRLVFDASLQALHFLVHPANEYLQDGQRIVSVCCDLAMRGLLEFPALKGLPYCCDLAMRGLLEFLP